MGEFSDERIGDGRSRATGVVAPGEVFEARDFLESFADAALLLHGRRIGVR
jgi:hypothetical protein